MEAIESALKCVECGSILECPVILPCSDSVCKKHIEPDSKEFHCMQCDLVHPKPSRGFPENRSLRILLEAKIQKTKFTPQYKSASTSFRNLAKSLDDLRLLQKDPHYFVNKKISELKNETDIVRDEFKLLIDQKADAIIKQLDQYEQECKSKLQSSDFSKKLEKLASDIDAIKREMDKWQKSLNSFESDEAELKMIQEKGDSYKTSLEMKLNAYEDDFLLNKLSLFQLKVASFCKIKLASDRK
jgi:hypothetical protein